MECIGTVVMANGDSLDFGFPKLEVNTESGNEETIIVSDHNTEFEKVLDNNLTFSWLRSIYNDIGQMFHLKAMRMAVAKVLTICNLTPVEEVIEGRFEKILIYAPDVLSEKQCDYIKKICGELGDFNNSVVSVGGVLEEYQLERYLKIVKPDIKYSKLLEKFLEEETSNIQPDLCKLKKKIRK